MTRTRRTPAHFIPIAVFIAIYLVVGYFWHVPPWVAGLYLGFSLLSYVLYAVDKSRAGTGQRRIPEKTLHLLALLGGWPGAIVAQQLLRHKTIKVRFRRLFWVTVVVNVVAFLVLASPWWRGIIAPLAL